MSVEAANAAFQRWVDALNRARDATALRTAVTDAIHIERHGPGTRDAAGAVLESFAGLTAVERWVALTPVVVTFALAGPASRAGDRWEIEYALVAGEFHNGGLWRATLADDGRIATLQHQPFALPDAR